MEHEERLANVLEELLADSEEPDWAAVSEEHPEIAGELRELYATAMIAEGFGSFQGGSAPTQICPPEMLPASPAKRSPAPQARGRAVRRL